MGWIRHHAILVTACDYPAAAAQLADAHALASRLGCIVSPITDAAQNGYQSFVVFPDGSKEGWPESDAGDERRATLVAWLDEQRYEDGSTGIRWVEVQYGDDAYDTRVVRDSDARQRKAEREARA